MEVLLEAGETRGIDLDLKNENGHCALMEAAAGGTVATGDRRLILFSAKTRRFFCFSEIIELAYRFVPKPGGNMLLLAI